VQDRNKSRIKLDSNYLFCPSRKPFCKVSYSCTDLKNRVLRAQISGSDYPVQIACVNEEMLVKGASFDIIFFKNRTNQKRNLLNRLNV